MKDKENIPETPAVETFTVEQLEAAKAEAIAAKEQELETYRMKVQEFEKIQQEAKIAAFTAAVQGLITFKSKIPGIDKFSAELKPEHESLLPALEELFRSIPEFPAGLKKEFSASATEPQTKSAVKVDPSKF